MSLDNILPHLTKVKKTHRGYSACCPVHNDKNPSMTLTETDDGKVLIHCFACGARGSDVVEALGLSPSELFSGEFTPDPRFRMNKIREHQLEDSMVISIYETDKKNGKYLTHSDYKRYRLAKARIEALDQSIM